MTTLASCSKAFGSMDALRHAHEHLFETMPDNDRSLSPSERESNARLINEFIGRAIATGAILDTLAERREAQACIDYWVASAFTKPRRRGTPEEEGPSPAAPSGAPRADNQLDRFDAKVIADAADRGDAFVKALSEKEKDLLQRILLALVRLPETGEEFLSVPRQRQFLRKFGDPDKVDKLLDGLQHAGILRSTEHEDELALSYPALTRRWQWFSDELKKRMNLRNLALSWVGSGRSYSALLGLRLTRRFREYSNLAPWETEFINKSSRFGWFKIVTLVVPVVLLVLGLSSNYLYESQWVPWWASYYTQQTTSSDTPVAKKVENIRWLAKYGQRVQVPRIQLTGPELKDLRGIYAPLAMFQDSHLTAVQFDWARLAGSTFNNSVIDRSSFQHAHLYRAIFDGTEFCGKVDFTGADVLYASFKRVKFPLDNIPIFAKAAWWQAHGWGFDEIAVLAREYPHTSIEESDIFKRELQLVVSKLDEAKEPVTRALRLNEKAWTLAIYGLVPSGEAEKSVRDALAILDELKQKNPKRDDGFLQTGFEDTLAYILMQKQEGQGGGAKNMQEAVRLLGHSAKLTGEGEILFRYAVALYATDNLIEAIESLRKALHEQQYQPSHELHLLHRHITGIFKSSVMDMTGRLDRKPPTKCGKGSAAGAAGGQRN